MTVKKIKNRAKKSLCKRCGGTRRVSVSRETVDGELVWYKQTCPKCWGEGDTAITNGGS